jgi:hypothetical protein
VPLLAGLLYPVIVLVPYPFTNLRYLAPSVPFLTIAGAALVATALTRLAPRPRRVGIVLVVMIGLAPVAMTFVDRLYLTDAGAHLVGRKSERDYLFLTRDPTMVRHFKMVEAVNRQVPPTGRLLLLFEARGLYLDGEVLQDNVLRNWVLLRPLIDRGGCLDGTGVTHVLVAEGLIDHYVRRGLDPATVRWGEFGAFARECLVLVERRPGDYALYAVRGSSRGGEDP